MSPRPRSAAVVAALLAWTLTACSDDPEPIVEPTPSPTSTAPTQPTSPPTSEPPERESAQEFIRRWQAEAFAMQVSGDTSRYRELSLNCESCDLLAGSVSEIYDSGGSVRFRGRHQVIDLVRVGKERGTLIFEYTLQSPRSEVLDSDGNVSQRFSGGRNEYQVNVVRREGGWSISSASRLAA
jgi:hypothetical protein